MVFLGENKLESETREQIIHRQDQYALEIEDIQKRLEQLEFDMGQLLHKLPCETFFTDYFYDSNDKIDDPSVIFKRVALFWIQQPEKAKTISDELSKYPEYIEFSKKQKDYENLKYIYYAKLYAFYKMISDDRKKVFDAPYLNLMDKLSERGWFIYYLQTPDIQFPNESIEDSEKFIYNLFSTNNCLYLHLLFRDFLEIETLNDLRRNKISDLKEALACISNGAYQSCARTMFALLENEHVNASSLIKRSRGLERSKKISKCVKDMGSTYYSKVWSKINRYYKSLNCDTDKMDSSRINRHDLAHGTYKHIATKEDCIKLFLLFITFKELSFYLQNMVDFMSDFKKDLISYIINEMSK